MIDGVHKKSAQYANDIWMILHPTQDKINHMTEIFDCFAFFSGLLINYKKTAVLRIGSLKYSDVRFYTLKPLFWSGGCIKILESVFILI